MDKSNVRIVKLEPIRVASVLGYGAEPENQAWEKLKAWAEPKGLMDLKEHRIFGFNNPNPTPGSPNYGYEFWITVGPEVDAEGEVEIKHFPGGLYAVLYCEVQGRPYVTIPAAWSRLVQWFEASGYQSRGDLCLEEHLETEGMQEGEFDLDLYLPIAE